MANISVGQEQLQVAEPTRQLARRQPLDLTSTFSGIAETFGGTQKALAKRKEDRQKVELNRSAQEIILDSEQDYLNTRDNLIASGNWNQETAFQLKNRSRMNLRRNLVSTGVVDKDLVSHAESQLSKVYVDGEWKTEDASLYFKQITSPNGKVSLQRKSDDEIFSSALIDISKTHPATGNKIAHATLGGEVMDSSGNVVVFNKKAATDMLVKIMESDEELERQKQAVQQRLQVLQVSKEELELTEQAANMIQPMYEKAFLDRADMVAYSMYADFDPASTNKEQLTIELTNAFKKITNSEALISFDSSNRQGQSINNILSSKYNNKASDLAKQYAETIYNSRVLDPELIKNQKALNATMHTAKLHGAAAVANSPVVRSLQKNIIIQSTGSLIGLSATSLDSSKADILASVTRGERLKTFDELALWRINNAQSASTIRDNEATLRVANPGSPEFENALQSIFNLSSDYVNDTISKDNMIDPSNGYVAAELALRNPKVREHFIITKKYTEKDIEEIMKALSNTSFKARLAVQDQDRIVGFNRLVSIDKFIDEAITESIKEPITKEKRPKPEFEKPKEEE